MTNKFFRRKRGNYFTSLLGYLAFVSPSNLGNSLPLKFECRGSEFVFNFVLSVCWPNLFEKYKECRTRQNGANYVKWLFASNFLKGKWLGRRFKTFFCGYKIKSACCSGFACEADRRQEKLAHILCALLCICSFKIDGILDFTYLYVHIYP
jgi:hypothetical protein